MERPAKRLQLFALATGIALVGIFAAIGTAMAAQGTPELRPTFTRAAAFDVSAPLELLSYSAAKRSASIPSGGPAGADSVLDGAGIAGAGGAASARGRDYGGGHGDGGPAGLVRTFEGLSNQDNFDVFGFRVNPPDPVGDVGPKHYVEMINLVFGVWDKQGNQLLGPVDTGTLWADFPVDECTEPSGDPIVIYDQFADRWILTQFTTRGLDFPNEPLNPFYLCVAISTTGDPTGSYYRYAFTTGFNFPDYPKFSVWRDSYLATTREFGIQDESIYGIGVYAMEKARMLVGDPNARFVGFLLKDGEVPLELIGDGLLPPDLDGKTLPRRDLPAPIVGTQDDDAPYGATFDALNIWHFDVDWNRTPEAKIALYAQLPVAEFDSIYPCGVIAVPGPPPPPANQPNARDCLPQPGVLPNQYLDILSYRQRPTWRLAFRSNGTYDTMVTNQSVEARPNVAGVRWYEIRRPTTTFPGSHRPIEYSVYQQGTYAPDDGVHRWMGSIAMNKKGDMALGYSVVNGTNVKPGIRYTGRRAHDPFGQMTLGETSIIEGTGVQTTLNSRWGDYTSMNVDPVDDCTFWYVNQYYTAAGQASSPAGWQTRIAALRPSHC